eukprot:5722414-Pyramimonas_sp.AAC.1
MSFDKDSYTVVYWLVLITCRRESPSSPIGRSGRGVASRRRPRAGATSLRPEEADSPSEGANSTPEGVN